MEKAVHFFFLLLSAINVLQAQWPVLTPNHRIPSAHLNRQCSQQLNTNGTDNARSSALRHSVSVQDVTALFVDPHNVQHI